MSSIQQPTRWSVPDRVIQAISALLPKVWLTDSASEFEWQIVYRWCMKAARRQNTMLNRDISLTKRIEGTEEVAPKAVASARTKPFANDAMSQLSGLLPGTPYDHSLVYNAAAIHQDPASFLSPGHSSATISPTQAESSGPSRRRTAKPFVCDWCLICNRRRGELQKHVSASCGSNSVWVCKIDKLRFTSNKQAWDHIGSSYPLAGKRDNTLKCTLCYEKQALACAKCAECFEKANGKPALCYYLQHIGVECKSGSNNKPDNRIRGLLQQRSLHAMLARLGVNNMDRAYFENLSWTYTSSEEAWIVQQLELGHVKDNDDPNCAIWTANLESLVQALILDGLSRTHPQSLSHVYPLMNGLNQHNWPSNKLSLDKSGSSNSTTPGDVPSPLEYNAHLSPYQGNGFNSMSPT